MAPQSTFPSQLINASAPRPAPHAQFLAPFAPAGGAGWSLLALAALTILAACMPATAGDGDDGEDEGAGAAGGSEVGGEGGVGSDPAGGDAAGGSATGGSLAGGAGGEGGAPSSGAGFGNGGFGSGMSSGGSAATGGGMAPPCDVDGVPGICVDVSDCGGGYVPVPGYCPGPAEIQCCIPSEPSTCDPDAAPQPNVGLVEAPGEGGCPAGMIVVADFCVDKYEASLVYAATGSPFSPYQNPGMAWVMAVSIEGAVPQGYINGEQAADACATAGKRLCTNTEWLRGCQGPSGYTYPYGDDLDLGVCNDHRAQHPAVEYFGTTDAWIWSELGNACINQLPNSLDATGDNPGCVTDEGAYDMMGNLHEWTSDVNGTFRGGFYVDTWINGDGCLYTTTAHDTYHWDYSTGFRCCADL